MISLVRSAFRYNVMQIMQGSFKCFQVQTHVQTARDSPDLNMDFHSFNNGCKTAIRLDIYARIFNTVLLMPTSEEVFPRSHDLNIIEHGI